MWVKFVPRGAVVALGLLCQSAGAAVAVIGDPADATIRKGGSISNGINAKRIGAGVFSSMPKDTGGSSTGVFVFRLPSPEPGELPIVDSADFQLNIQTHFADTPYNLDLYGLNARTLPKVLIADNYFGPLDTNGPALLQDDLVPMDNTLTGWIHPSAAGDLALANYLTGQYGADGSGAGKYVFIRLNPDIDPPMKATGIEVSMGEETTAPPLLTISFAADPAGLPEPGAALAGIVGLGLWALRRRRPRTPQ